MRMFFNFVQRIVEISEISLFDMKRLFFFKTSSKISMTAATKGIFMKRFSVIQDWVSSEDKNKGWPFSFPA